ncbi:Uncharacterized membrane-anchored protein YitT, contains DUF161 and DUF2179 domains [Anaerosphaera aminiphila DSM 21120]|uniref:Uncharacterized membrane-anchored protein YitT, contains DUF161 and DUF2179 domains n=1 Tax=Anaerosphaera aminiphila DSM 21120 TaxID=1120995 RepID=A0A1M5TAH1_9FIRM|nr:YitT family protein [Anaerosphaera aminiphila]SHH47678.1 Uncharacterized membrane-anchored protein YitT, contains DUF161 and DUF2179 domains [Anaerosphaera aminiphila DSM 21120]
MKINLNLKMSRSTLLRKLAGIVVGCMFSAFAIVCFLRPNEMISGGITGLAILMESITGIPLSVLVFMLNIPIFILGIFFLNIDFMFFSGIGIVVFSLWLSFFERVVPTGYAVTNEVMLACIFGGAVNGLGSGILFRNGTSAGGLDIPAAIMKKKFNISIGNVLFLFNVVIVGWSSIIYSIDKALFTLVVIFVTNQVIDTIQLGVGKQKQVFIISNKYREITKVIHEKIGRGSTYIDGEGAYNNNKVKIIYLICTSRQIVKVKDTVREIDPNAFVAVSDTVEIEGKGFKKIEI